MSRAVAHGLRCCIRKEMEEYLPDYNQRGNEL